MSNKRNASDLVLDIIQKKLQSGEWSVGAKIATEVQLMKEAGVGRPAVREAIEKMVAMDILVKRQGDGTYVNDLSVSSHFNQLLPGLMLNHYDSISILEFREVIEPACVQMFIHNFDEAIYASLKQYLEIMKQYQNDRNRDDFYKADRDYHLAIARGCGNPILIKVMEILTDAMTRYHSDAHKTIGSKTGAAEHEAILNAIESRDAELAALLMKRHIQRSKRDIQEYAALQESTSS